MEQLSRRTQGTNDTTRDDIGVRLPPQSLTEKRS
jgi:hypothetical protein